MKFRERMVYMQLTWRSQITLMDAKMQVLNRLWNKEFN